MRNDLHLRIAKAGGLFTKAGLAKRRGVSQQYIGKVTARDDFPKPIRVNDGGTKDREVWTAEAADAWFDTHRRSTE